MPPRWKRRLRKWLKAGIYLLLIALPFGLAEDSLHGWLRGLLASRWVMVARFLLEIVGHPWFPWALIPLGIFALILKEFLEEEDQFPVVVARKKRWETRETLGQFTLKGENLLRRLERQERGGVILRDISDWEKSVEEYLEQTLGIAYIARFRNFANLLPLDPPIPDVEYRDAWRTISNRLSRLAEFIQEHRD